MGKRNHLGHVPQWFNNLATLLNVQFTDEVKAVEIVAGRILGSLGPDLGYEYVGDGILYGVVRSLVLQSALKVRESCGDFRPGVISGRLTSNHYFRLLMVERLAVSTRTGAYFNLANGFERLVALLFVESGSIDRVLTLVQPLIQPDIDAYLAAKDRDAFLEKLRRAEEEVSAYEQHDAVTLGHPPRTELTPGEQTIATRVGDQSPRRKKRRRKRGRKRGKRN